jgi:hypothetical protein
VDDMARSKPSASFWTHVHLLEAQRMKGTRGIYLFIPEGKKNYENILLDNQNKKHCSTITATNSEASSCWLLHHKFTHVILWEAQMWSLTNQSQYRVGSEDGLTSTMANQSCEKCKYRLYVKQAKFCWCRIKPDEKPQKIGSWIIEIISEVEHLSGW